MMFFPACVTVKPQPRGVALIIPSEANPVITTLCPLLLAMSSGNGVIVRLSNGNNKTTEVIKKYMEHFLDRRYYKLLIEPAEKNVEACDTVQDFDYVYCSAPRETCKLVAKMASKNLVPFTFNVEDDEHVIVVDSNPQYACAK